MHPSTFIQIALLLPLVGAILIALRSAMGADKAARFAILIAGVSLVLHLLCGLKLMGWGQSFSIERPWIDDQIRLRFHYDGMAFLFVLLTQVVVLVSLVTSVQRGIGARSYFALILLLETALFGVFTSRDFIPWFLCWEMTLIPSYLLIRMWGGDGAPKAALRFFIMTLGGSAFMLVGFLVMLLATGTMSFDMLASHAADGRLAPALGEVFASTGIGGESLLIVVALCVFLGLAVKLPVVPFHGWLPAAYAEAPTPVTMLLTGLLSKMGVYGLLRIFLPVFDEVLPVLAPWLAVLAVATVLLGAVAALAQTDLKRMLAYSSVNHLGYCALAMVAVAAAGGTRAGEASALSGTVLQAINHGVIATGLFYGISVLESRSGGKRGLNDFGGLRAQTPVFCGVYGLVLFASLGLPGLSGFVGEFLIFNGAFATMPAAAALSVIGLLLTAVFLLRMIRKVFTGPLKPGLAGWADLGIGERVVFGVLVALIVLPGLFPQLLLKFCNPDLVLYLDRFSQVP